MTRSPRAIVPGALALGAAILLAACAGVPSQPSIVALPGSAKSADEYRADDAACRQFAAAEAMATEQWRYDMTYLQCMYAKGNQIPVPGGALEPSYVSPSSAAPVSPPPVSPPPVSPPSAAPAAK